MQVSGVLPETGELATVTIVGSKIKSVLPGAADDALGGPDVMLASGFFDLQINGYAGHDFNRGLWQSAGQSQDALIPLFGSIAKSGTALFCPTVVTNSFESMRGSLEALAALLADRSDLARSVPGIHLEGPCISALDGPRGAHPLAHVRKPDYEEFLHLQDAAEGRIRIVTLAPELEGGLLFIERLASDGVIVAIGHTAASPEIIRDAVAAGALMSTHLGNGAHSMLPRHPNYIWEQLAADELYASIITDGHHLPPAVIQSMVRCKSAERTVLVSDAVSLGGLPPGIYSNGQHEVLPDGKVVLAGTPYLAGAGHLLDTCVANAIRYSDMIPCEALECVSSIPAEILGLQDVKGNIAQGYDADLTLWNWNEEGPLTIVATICGGNVIYTK